MHHFWATIAEERPDEPHVTEPARPPDAELLDWYRGRLDRLHAVLTAADPQASCSTWTPQRDMAWIQRRMAQETAVHRWDGEASVGAAAPIEPVLAVDGVDEFLEFFVERAPGIDGTVHLHATDAEGEWLIGLASASIEVSRGHAKGDVAVRGPASSLLLLLWRRVGFDDLEVFGDESLAAAFVGSTDLE